MEDIRHIAEFGNALNPPSIRGIEAKDGALDQLGALAILVVKNGLADHKTRMAGIPARHLNAEGLKAATTKAHAASLEDFDHKLTFAPGKFRRQLADKRAKAEKTLDGDDGLDQASRAIFATKLWSMLPEDPLALRDIHEKAVDAGDVLVARTIENLPIIHGGRLEPAVVADLRAARLESVDGVVSAELSRLNEISRDLDKAERLVREAINEGLPQINPVEEILAGRATRDDRGELVKVEPEPAEASA